MTQIVEAVINPLEPDEPQLSEHPVVAEGRALLDEMLAGQEPQSLSEWRIVIDELNFSLFSVMAARIAATERVSILKAQGNAPAVDLSREREILGQGREAARAMDIDASAVQGLLLALIGRAHTQHNEVRRGTSTL
jgi:chorismate mutase